MRVGIAGMMCCDVTDGIGNGYSVLISLSLSPPHPRAQPALTIFIVSNAYGLESRPLLCPGGLDLPRTSFRVEISAVWQEGTVLRFRVLELAVIYVGVSVGFEGVVGGCCCCVFGF